jgi:plastocyanin
MVPAAATPYPYAFSPTSVTVGCGGTVHISNRTTTDHNVSPSHGGFTASSDVPMGGTTSLRLFYKGNFGFYCTLHPTMTGTFHVT